MKIKSIYIKDFRNIKEFNLECSVKEFKDEVDWSYISEYQRLSEDFIREFKDKVIWN